MSRVLSAHHGRGSQNAAQAARDRIVNQSGEGGSIIDGRTVLCGDGRVIGWRAAEFGDGHECVEYSPVDGLRFRLAFCEGQAAEYARRAATWPEGHQLRARNLVGGERWRAEADIVRGRISLVERLALGHLAITAATGAALEGAA